MFAQINYKNQYIKGKRYQSYSEFYLDFNYIIFKNFVHLVGDSLSLKKRGITYNECCLVYSYSIFFSY